MTDRHAATGRVVMAGVALAGTPSAAVSGVGTRPVRDIILDIVPPLRPISCRCRVPNRVRCCADTASDAEV